VEERNDADQSPPHFAERHRISATESS
jgi:hypothetical protein